MSATRGVSKDAGFADAMNFSVSSTMCLAIARLLNTCLNGADWGRCSSPNYLISRQCVDGVDRLSCCSGGTNDDVAAEAHKQIETRLGPCTTFDADSYAVNAQYNPEFYPDPMFVLDACDWIFRTQ
jgi:hypothetical protein